MAKQTLAMFITKQEGGRRTYTLMNRYEEIVDTITVMDAGQGAARAHELAKQKYNVSQAQWAYDLARKHGI